MSTSSSGISFDVNEFTDKRVLVTGGTKGAGKAIADRFRRGGATVIVTARSAPEEKTDSHFIQADVSTFSLQRPARRMTPTPNWLKLSNPVAALISVPFQNNFDFGGDDREGDR